MRSAHWQLASRIEALEYTPPDLLVASDFVDLCGFLGICHASWASLPTVYYLHENQVTYPRSAALERDDSYGFTNILSCLRAAAVVFNSRYHLNDFRSGADAFLARLPQPNPREQLAHVLDSALVVAPGFDPNEIPLGPGGPESAPCRVLFNHRWEHDKDPAEFLRAICAVRDRGVAVELVLLGEWFESVPADVTNLLNRLEPVILQRGFVPDRQEYARWVGSCDVVVSTARHEFFGVAITEALAAGAAPLLPNRLSYPELLPPALHADGLYDDIEDLALRLAGLAADTAALRNPSSRHKLRDATSRFSIDETAKQMDSICQDVVTGT